MKRRNFIKISTSGAAGSLMINGFTAKALNSFTMGNVPGIENYTDRIIVLIELKGGNDGLNTLIPYDTAEYDEYLSLRPNVGLDKDEITLTEIDSSLTDSNKRSYLHPAFTDGTRNIKSLYDEGLMAVVHGVGYNQINKSHFAGIANILKGTDPETGNKPDGWVGRYLDSHFNTEIDNGLSYPLGIQFGSVFPLLAFASGNETGVNVNLAGNYKNRGQNLINYNETFNPIGSVFGNSPIADNIIPVSTHGEYIKYIQSTKIETQDYAEAITNAYNTGITSLTAANWNPENIDYYPSDADYQDNELLHQLQSVAALIKGGLQTKVYTVVLSNFDTHGKQVDASSDENKSKGAHASLLRKLNDAIYAFQTELASGGYDEKVVTMTFSEFGRKVKDNGNKGTDHGNIAPWFIFGKEVTGGIKGHNPSLLEVDSNRGHYNLGELMQFDYRRVIGEVLGGFIGVSSQTMEDVAFNQYLSEGANSIGLFERYSLSRQDSFSKDFIESEDVILYPNPVNNLCHLNFNSKYWYKGFINVYNVEGAVVNRISIVVKGGNNSIQVNLSSLSTGSYYISVFNESGVSLFTKQLTKL